MTCGDNLADKARIIVFDSANSTVSVQLLLHSRLLGVYSRGTRGRPMLMECPKRFARPLVGRFGPITRVGLLITLGISRSLCLEAGIVPRTMGQRCFGPHNPLVWRKGSGQQRMGDYCTRYLSAFSTHPTHSKSSSCVVNLLT